MAPLSSANHITADLAALSSHDLNVYMVVLASIDSWIVETYWKSNLCSSFVSSFSFFSPSAYFLDVLKPSVAKHVRKTWGLKISPRLSSRRRRERGDNSNLKLKPAELIWPECCWCSSLLLTSSTPDELGLTLHLKPPVSFQIAQICSVVFIKTRVWCHFINHCQGFQTCGEGWF